MDRHTLRDWVRCPDEEGPAGLSDRRGDVGPERLLSPGQEAGVTPVQAQDDDTDGPACPDIPPMSEAEMACRIGDLLEVFAPLDLSGTMEDPSPSVVSPSGQVYKVVALFGRGWDLELVSGDGPNEVRTLNRYIRQYFRPAGRADQA